MAQGNLTLDGSTDWFELTYEQTYISVDGTFGGGAVALEKLVNGTAYPLRESGTPISITAASDVNLNIGSGAKVRLTLSGSTGADIDWAINARQIRKV